MFLGLSRKYALKPSLAPLNHIALRAKYSHFSQKDGHKKVSTFLKLLQKYRLQLIPVCLDQTIREENDQPIQSHTQSQEFFYIFL